MIPEVTGTKSVLPLILLLKNRKEKRLRKQSQALFHQKYLSSNGLLAEI